MRAMLDDVRAILPTYTHHLVSTEAREVPGFHNIVVPPASAGEIWLHLISKFPPFSVAHTASLIGPGSNASLRRAALLLAPTRHLAYNPDGDRFHLHPRQPLASLLFSLGHPVHQIHLRPWRDETRHFDTIHQQNGCSAKPGRPTIAILTPYLPWPLSHGGAVRIHALLQQAAPHYNLKLFAFTEDDAAPNLGPLSDLCEQITWIRKPEYRYPRWCSLRPSEVREYDTPAMHRALSEATYDLLQVEYTHLAPYGRDILVEHDVTYDLARQVQQSQPTLSHWWNFQRWHHFERQALQRYRRAVVMSDKDQQQLALPNTRVLPNGVDLARFQPTPEPSGPPNLLFIGSFRHFPNVRAYQFLVSEFWPHFYQTNPKATLTVVAGPNPRLYQRDFSIPPGVDFHEFVADVKPLYDQAHLVLVPTPVSAGTNIKVLEAMAMQRTVISTSSGAAGLRLAHKESVWIANSGPEYLAAANHLLHHAPQRKTIAQNARRIGEQHFDWQSIGHLQTQLWQELL
jgi:glycosyltransferase involved in cell wall biosynthesis